MQAFPYRSSEFCAQKLRSLNPARLASPPPPVSDGMTPGIVRDGRDTNTQMVKVFGCRQAYESGMTMLVVSHEMQFVHDVASRVVFMDGGQIVEQGRPREIFRDRPKSERLAAAAKRFFKRLLQGLRYKPRRIITDGLRSYGVAQRAILPDVRHRLAGISRMSSTRLFWRGRAIFSLHG
jgi:ABC-type antimicrobial peptide transport system ATPase subunit